jgi:hypothetical protein
VDGKCNNCVRFSQDCIFAPVAANAGPHFVPVNQVYNMREGGPPVQLYGAYGQPIRQEDAPRYPAIYPPPGQYGPPPPGYQPYPPHPGYSYPPPATQPPAAHAPPATQQHVLPAPSAPAQHTPPQPPRDEINGNKRKATSTLPPSLPPPNPALSSTLPRTLAPEPNGYHRYPEPTAWPNTGQPASPAGASPYHTSTSYSYNPPPLPAARSAAEYDAERNRASASPNTLGSAGASTTSVQPNTSYPVGSEVPNSAAPVSAVSGQPPPTNPTSRSANDYHRQLAATLPPPQPSSTPTAPQVNGNGGHVSPTHNSTSGATASPTSAQTNGRSGMSIHDIVSSDGRPAPDIDSAMKARLNINKSYAPSKQ